MTVSNCKKKSYIYPLESFFFLYIFLLYKEDEMQPDPVCTGNCSQVTCVNTKVAFQVFPVGEPSAIGHRLCESV